MSYRLGIFGARADNRGLSIQTQELARHLNPEKVLGIDMGELSPYPNNWEMFDRANLQRSMHDKLVPENVQQWLQGLDVVIGCETFYYPFFTSIAKQMNVKTVLVANFEFTSHIMAADWAPVPDVLAVPTTWHMDELPNAYLLPHGIDRERLPYVPRTSASTFLHIIGHSAAYDRQGTKLVMEALRFVKSPIKLLVRSQRGLSIPRPLPSHIDIEIGDENITNYWELYSRGDVLLHPRRYGGQSLVMNEALSVGMPVLMPNAEPQSRTLPPEMMLNHNSFRRFRSLVGDIPLHDIYPQELANRIDELVNNPDKVARLSAQADQIAERQSWPNVLPEYEKLFNALTGS